jgi:hypothetical protein
MPHSKRAELVSAARECGGTQDVMHNPNRKHS